MIWIRAAVLLLLATMAAAASASNRFGPGGMFPQMETTAIAYDQRGVLWWGTSDELIRFDGHRVVPVVLEVYSAVQDRGIRALLATPTGMLVATANDLRHMDRLGQRQTRILAEGQSLGGIVALVRQRDTALAVTEAGVVYRLAADAGAGMAERLLIADWPATDLRVRNVRATPDWLYVAANDGVHRLDLAVLRAEAVPLGVAGLPDTASVSAVHEDSRFLWIGLWTEGLVRIDRTDGQRRWYRPDSEPGRVRTQSIFDFAQGTDGRLFIGTNRGIVVYRPECDCLEELRSPDWSDDDNQGVVVDQLLADRAGLWAVTIRGLYRFEASSFPMKYLQRRDEGNGLASKVVYGLHVDRSRLWMAGYGHGVQWISDASLAPERWQLQGPPAAPEGASFPWDVAADGEDALLASGWGLYRLQAGRVEVIDATVQSLRRVFRSADQVWIGARSGLYRSRDGRMQPHAIRAPVWDFLSDGPLLWVAGEDGLHGLHGDQQRIHIGVGPETGKLPGSTVFRIETDARGRRWLATSGGLLEWQQHADEHRFIRQPALAAHGIFQVYSLVDADQGRELWLGTPQGVVRYRPPAEVRVFTARDGVMPGHFWPRSAARVGDRVFMANSSGVTHFRPADLAGPTPRLEPALLRWRIDQEVWQDAEQVTLRPDQRALAIEFWSGDYVRADAVRYEFALRGRDRSFRSLGYARELLLDGLQPGVYELWLAAALQQVPDSRGERLILRIEVQPTWYQHRLGQLLLLAFALVALTALIRLRERWMRHHAATLQALVDARTAELERANQRLHEQARQDALTGLPNRRRLFEFAERLDSAAYSLLLIDIDHFKQINDRHGHQIGDLVLVAFARLLDGSASLCSEALAVRNGGEEFVLVLPGIDRAGAETIAFQLLRDTRALELRGDDGTRIAVTVSIGIAEGQAGESIDGCLHRADQAMYRAKQSGRDAIVGDGWPADRAPLR